MEKVLLIENKFNVDIVHKEINKIDKTEGSIKNILCNNKIVSEIINTKMSIFINNENNEGKKDWGSIKSRVGSIEPYFPEKQKVFIIEYNDRIVKRNVKIFLVLFENKK